MVYPHMIVPKSVPGGANTASLGFANTPSAAQNAGQGDRSGSTSSTGTGGGRDDAAGAGGAGHGQRGGQHGGAATGGANAAVKAERFRPRIFGFQLNESAKLMRWQEAMRDKQVDRLEKQVIE